jgi:hypothetical protein
MWISWLVRKRGGGRSMDVRKVVRCSPAAGWRMAIYPSQSCPFAGDVYATFALSTVMANVIQMSDNPNQAVVQ